MYETTLPFADKAGAGAGVIYVGRRAGNTANTQDGFELPAYATVQLNGYAGQQAPARVGRAEQPVQPHHLRQLVQQPVGHAGRAAQPVRVARVLVLARPGG